MHNTKNNVTVKNTHKRHYVRIINPVNHITNNISFQNTITVKMLSINYRYKLGHEVKKKNQKQIVLPTK